MARQPSLRALVLGGANTLAADRAAALEMFEPDLVIACNHAARDEPGRVDAWATMHAELLPSWIALRTRAGHPPAESYWHARHRVCTVPGANPIESWGGSSGLLCVAVAFKLGCSHVVLAGVPMVKTFGHYDDKRHWMEARQYWPAWERRLPQMRDRVRSLSGWTRDLLQGPTQEWLDGNPA